MLWHFRNLREYWVADACDIVNPSVAQVYSQLLSIGLFRALSFRVLHQSHCRGRCDLLSTPFDKANLTGPVIVGSDYYRISPCSTALYFVYS